MRNHLGVMQKLFNRIPFEGAYFIKKDSLFVRFDERETHELSVENVIVGAIESYLHSTPDARAGKLFDLFVRDASKLKTIPLSTAEQMMRDFRYGFNSNIFLSRLLELTNNYYSKTTRQVPKELWQYKIRAQYFSKLVNAVFEFAEDNDLIELADLAREKMERDFYVDGVVLSREIVLKAISTPSRPLSEFVIRYKANSCICREGSPADAMYVLLRGRVGVATFGRRAATIVEAGEAFGEVALFLDGKRTATLVAEDDTDLYVVKRSELPRFFATHRDLFVNIAATLAQRIQDNIEKTKRFQKKLEELKKLSANGGYRTLEERSKHEMNELCAQLLELQTLNRELPAFDRFLDLNDIRPERLSS